MGRKEIYMNQDEEKHCLQVYKKYLESNTEKYAYVTELKRPGTEKAVVVSIFCIDFEKTKHEWSDLHSTCIVYFWIPRRFSFANCSNGCNTKIPKWLAIKNLERCISEGKTSLIH